jgi:transposase
MASMGDMGAGLGMLIVETIAKVRRAYFLQGKSIKAICREFRLSRKVVRKVIRSEATEFRYERGRQPLPRIDPWRDQIDGLLLANEEKPARERLTLVRVFEEARRLGFEGGYDAVRRYARGWRAARGAEMAQAYVPLSFAPGEAYQFDWSHEIVLMKTAVESVFVGKDRQFNRRFLQMCGHYLAEPTACTPAAGWEKGQVENQVGNLRERLFTPRLRVASYAELNAWLLDQCVARAKANRHPELADQTVWQVFEAERPQLVPIGSRFDGFRATQASVSKTCLLRFDSNKYSVASRAVGRPLEVQAYAERIVIRQDGVVVGEHARSFGRNQTIYDPWHYVPVLARKPGALRNGAPFKDWLLPANLERVRHRLKGSDDGDRQMVRILSAVLTDGLAAVEAACAEALAGGVHSADVVLNILARRRDPGPVATILAPEALRLRQAPIADCARYDRLRRIG